MKTSDTIGEIAKALHKFHSEVGKIKKGSNNPFFKSKYAALPDILDAISEPLSSAELVIVQFPCDNWGLTTRLLHVSGEYFEETYHMTPVKQTPQDAGSVITYQRRYAIGAILNLNIDEDDDGHRKCKLSQWSKRPASAGCIDGRSPGEQHVPWTSASAGCIDGRSPGERHVPSTSASTGRIDGRSLVAKENPARRPVINI